MSLGLIARSALVSVPVELSLLRKMDVEQLRDVRQYSKLLAASSLKKVFRLRPQTSLPSFVF